MWRFLLISGINLERNVDKGTDWAAHAAVDEDSLTVEISDRIPPGGVARAVAGAIGIILGEADSYVTSPYTGRMIPIRRD